MECPDCGHDNVPGADYCEDCGRDLTQFDAPRASSDIERTIMDESLASLRPAAPIAVSPETPVRDVIRQLDEKGIGCVLIVWEEAMVGIFTERDALYKVAHRYNEVADDPIREFMTPAPETLGSKDSIAFALNRMAVGGFRHIPVEEDEKPVGIVSVRDILRYLTTRFRGELLAKK